VISKIEDCLESGRETQLSAHREGWTLQEILSIVAEAGQEDELINVNGKVDCQIFSHILKTPKRVH
jgi:hypothetical protein